MGYSISLSRLENQVLPSWILHVEFNSKGKDTMQDFLGELSKILPGKLN